MHLVAVPILIALGLLIAGIVYQWIGTHSAARAYPAPGTHVNVDGHRLHVFCAGNGAPTVVLESGVAASSLSWSLVQPEVARFTRVCSYDRAGLGWSDTPRRPARLTHMVHELHRLLTHGGIPGPYVLVGHSFGGFIARAYAAAYPAEVVGMVLVDSAEPDEWLDLTAQQRRMLRGGVLLARLGWTLAHIGIVRACLALLTGGAPSVPRNFVKVFGTAAATTLERMVGEVRKLPPDVLRVVQALWCQPKCFQAMAAHLATVPEAAAHVASLDMAPDLPLTVISAGDQPPDRIAQHQALARRSSQGHHLVAGKSGHWVQFDEPELVVGAIRKVVDGIRDRGASSG